MEEENFVRNCPDCGKEISYKTKGNLKSAENKNRSYVECGHKKHNYSGENNPFYGKSHSQETKDIISKKRIGKSNSPETVFGKRIGWIPNRKPVYQCWLDKYGKEEADRRFEVMRNKHSKNNSGSGNPMFGKTAPMGSGNGWSGWYKDWYFRSLFELSYMILVIEKEDLKWESGEQKKYRVPYIDEKGNNRNYFVDFIINNCAIECKPKHLQKTLKILNKASYAIEFFKNINMSYELIEPKKLSDEQIMILYKQNLIKFLPRYEEKFKKKYLNNGEIE